MLTLSAGLLWFYAINQSLHPDESSQLAGLTLSRWEMLRWLAGDDPLRFAVPSDRMPPLWYLIQSVWRDVISGSVYSLRLLSILATLTGLAFFAALARRIAPDVTGLLALALIAVSINVLQFGIMIRSYAAFFGMACAAAWMIFRYCEARGTAAAMRWLAGITALGLAAIYTHFYGVIFAFGTVASLGLLALVERRSIKPHCLSLSVLAVACAGLVPFLTASLGVKFTIPHGRIEEFPKLLYRLIGSRASAVYLPVQVALIGGTVLAIAATAAPRILALFRQKPLANISAFHAVCVSTIIIGLAASATATLLVRGFNPLEMHYHIWLLPFIFALALDGRSELPVPAPKVRYISLITAVAASLASAGILVSNVAVFQHGPATAMQETLDKLPPGTPVIYGGAAGEMWPFASYPLSVLRAGTLPQYLAFPGDDPSSFKIAAANDRFVPQGLRTITRAQALQNTDTVVFAEVANVYAEDAVNFIRKAVPSIPDTEQDKAFADAIGFEVVTRIYVPGYYAARIAVMRRK